MKVDVLLGLQWGDEGKGKVVDVLTPKYDVVTRFQRYLRTGFLRKRLYRFPAILYRRDGDLCERESRAQMG